jgi:hypothetical protein
MSDPSAPALDDLSARLERIETQQAEQLAVLREHLDLVRDHYDRAERLQERAERLQDRSDALLRIARGGAMVLLPILLLAMALLVASTVL